jgi:hypothetical protein
MVRPARNLISRSNAASASISFLPESQIEKLLVAFVALERLVHSTHGFSPALSEVIDPSIHCTVTESDRLAAHSIAVLRFMESPPASKVPSCSFTTKAEKE